MEKKFQLILAFLLLTAGTCQVVEARADPSADAKKFLQDLYSLYKTKGDAPQVLGVDAPKFFDDRLVKLIRGDAARADGEVGSIDADPVCDCQDHTALYDLSIKTIEQTPDKVSAEVHFRNGSTATRLRYVLLKTDQGWRIDDIGSRDVPSLVRLLKDNTEPTPK